MIDYRLAFMPPSLFIQEALDQNAILEEVERALMNLRSVNLMARLHPPIDSTMARLQQPIVPEMATYLVHLHQLQHARSLTLHQLSSIEKHLLRLLMVDRFRIHLLGEPGHIVLDHPQLGPLYHGDELVGLNDFVLIARTLKKADQPSQDTKQHYLVSSHAV